MAHVRLTTNEVTDRMPHLMFLVLKRVPCFRIRMAAAEQKTAKALAFVSKQAAVATSRILVKSRRLLLKPGGCAVV